MISYQRKKKTIKKPKLMDAYSNSEQPESSSDNDSEFRSKEIPKKSMCS